MSAYKSKISEVSNLVCYFVLPFKTISQTEKVTKESSDTSGITLGSRVTTKKLQVPMPWCESILTCITSQLCVISTYHPADNFFFNNLKEAWYSVVFCLGENVFLIHSKNVLNQSNNTYILDYMSSDSFEQKSATLNLHLARLQLQAK